MAFRNDVPLHERNRDGNASCLFRANSVYEPEAHHEGAIELVTVMKGKVSIQVENDVYELNEFDSIQFEANKKHSYRNNEDEVAVLHLTMKYFKKSPIEKNSIGDYIFLLKYINDAASTNVA